MFLLWDPSPVVKHHSLVVLHYSPNLDLLRLGKVLAWSPQRSVLLGRYAIADMSMRGSRYVLHAKRGGDETEAQGQELRGGTFNHLKGRVRYLCTRCFQSSVALSPAASHIYLIRSDQSIGRDPSSGLLPSLIYTVEVNAKLGG